MKIHHAKHTGFFVAMFLLVLNTALLSRPATKATTADLATVASSTDSSRLVTIIIMATASVLASYYIIWYWLHHRSSILVHHKIGTHAADPDSDVVIPSTSQLND